MSGTAEVLPLQVGRTFTAVTEAGRIIPLAKVIDYEGWRDGARYKCVWYDENGKHYEWFNLDDTSVEFKTFSYVS